MDSTPKNKEYLFVGEDEQTEGYFGRVNSMELYVEQTVDHSSASNNQP